ncbi:undecaprenyl-diphosphate phosphatase [Kineococcus aurantiacus]|uniref:Undecaprenyl-diphosphatase n=1 Tax=Kineococcus aurantiacus TaxID=37633 RepID=A0A7Y9J1D5_9ACTN|nr:undecaprenyl-diphosphatase [Kineococcus aurantiacus]
MQLWQSAVLGVVEGLTEFLPVSSTGHLTVVEELLGLRVDDAGTTAFTAIVQFGAIVAVIGYFRRDIARLLLAWVRGLRDPAARQEDYRLAWSVVVGSVPVGLVGFAARDVVAGPLRSLWVVASALIGWSVVMVAAEAYAARRAARHGEARVRLPDALVIGLVQCLSLVPGVSRSGATISAGLFRGLDRVTATRLSFFLSIPALTAAGLYEGVSAGGDVSATVGWGATALGTLVSLVVAYASIAWLLRFVAHHRISVFAGYRVGLGAVLLALLATGTLSAV